MASCNCGPYWSVIMLPDLCPAHSNGSPARNVTVTITTNTVMPQPH